MRPCLPELRLWPSDAQPKASRSSRGYARAGTVLRFLVVDDRAKLTHGAATGSVDKKQIETLMARGLMEDEAVDVVVKGMLR